MKKSWKNAIKPNIATNVKRKPPSRPDHNGYSRIQPKIIQILR